MGGFEGVGEGGKEQSSEYEYAHGVWCLKGMQLEAGGGSRVRLRLPGRSDIRCLNESYRKLSMVSVAVDAGIVMCGWPSRRKMFVPLKSYRVVTKPRQ